MDRGSQLDEDDEDDKDDKDDKEDEEDEEERRRGGGGGGRGRRQEEATDIKSNNPHLAGGEKELSFGNVSNYGDMVYGVRWFTC